MNKKTLQRVLCFCLALCFCFSIVIKPVEAHAVATESWMVYALITYLASMGITFTVAGGVDAMVQAMEEKVKDYEQQNNIIDFYEYVRNNNVRLVPNNNQDPDGNSFFDLFFTGAAVEAIQAFAEWLTTVGGWNKGGTVSSNVNEIQFFTSNGTKYLSDSRLVYSSTEGIYKLGDTFTLEELLSISVLTDSGDLTFQRGATSTQLDAYLDGVKVFTKKLQSNLDAYSPFTFCIHHNYGTPSDVVTLVGLIHEAQDEAYLYTGSNVFSGSFVVSGVSYKVSYVYTDISAYVDIMTPEELQEQFPSVDQGVSIKDAISVPIGDPSLIEWAQRMEETFNLTGTIPQPVPEVVADPELVPQPTPVPTPTPPPSYDDVDDLGLPTLGDALLKKFPFCLPSDIGRLMDIFTAERVTPYWEVDLLGVLGDRIPFRGDTSFAIDLAEYEELGAISRWTTTIGYCLLLILITRQMITW